MLRKKSQSLNEWGKKKISNGVRITVKIKQIKTDVELAWWHANTFPMHRFADTFDDVISTAVATGALGSGTAGLVLRGGVVA